MITESMLEKLDASPILRHLFIQKFVPYYDDENPRFLFAVQRFRRNPQMDEFLKVYYAFIKPKMWSDLKLNRPPVNLPDVKRVPLDAFIENYEKNKAAVATLPTLSYDKPLPVPANKFDASYKEIFKLMNDSINNKGANRIQEMFLFLVQNGLLQKAQGA